MTFENKIKEFLKKGLDVMFDLDKLRFNDIIIKRHVIEDICDFSRDSYPKEFLSFFHGIVEKNVLIIDRLLYHQYESSNNSAIPIFQFDDRNFYGSVHSHPSNNNRPSNNDLLFFRKTGIVHCIICKPFKEDNIQFYNHHGEKIEIKIE